MQIIVTSTAPQGIVAFTTVQCVITGQAIDCIVRCKPYQVVLTQRALQHFLFDRRHIPDRAITKFNGIQDVSAGRILVKVVGYRYSFASTLQGEK